MTPQFVSQVWIGDRGVPKVLLGTSPFIGAGQFGDRALSYYSRLYKRPKNIVKIIIRSSEIGVKGIQLLPCPPVVRALREAERELGSRFTVLGTVTGEEDIALLQEFETASMLLHGEVTDSRNQQVIRFLLDKIKETGSSAGLATHRPLRTLNWLYERELDFDVIMVPLNRAGLFMDGEVERVAEALKGLGKPVIAKKTLAAGRLPPEEALRYVADLGCVDVVAIGVASEEEAEETFQIALRHFR